MASIDLHNYSHTITMASLGLSEVRHEPLVARGISHYSCAEKFRSLLIAPRVRYVNSAVYIHEIDVRLIYVFGICNIILLLKRNSCSYQNWPKVARAATNYDGKLALTIVAVKFV